MGEAGWRAAIRLGEVVVVVVVKVRGAVIIIIIIVVPPSSLPLRAITHRSSHHGKRRTRTRFRPTIRHRRSSTSIGASSFHLSSPAALHSRETTPFGDVTATESSSYRRTGKHSCDRSWFVWKWKKTYILWFISLRRKIKSYFILESYVVTAL